MELIFLLFVIRTMQHHNWRFSFHPPIWNVYDKRSPSRHRVIISNVMLFHSLTFSSRDLHGMKSKANKQLLIGFAARRFFPSVKFLKILKAPNEETKANPLRIRSTKWKNLISLSSQSRLPGFLRWRTHPEKLENQWNLIYAAQSFYDGTHANALLKVR